MKIAEKIRGEEVVERKSKGELIKWIHLLVLHVLPHEEQQVAPSCPLCVSWTDLCTEGLIYLVNQSNMVSECFSLGVCIFFFFLLQ